DLDGRDLRGAGSDPQPVDEGLHRLLLSAREHLDAPVGKIARVTLHTQLAGALCGRGAIEHALHATGDQAFSENDSHARLYHLRAWRKSSSCITPATARRRSSRGRYA